MKRLRVCKSEALNTFPDNDAKNMILHILGPLPRLNQ